MNQEQRKYAIKSHEHFTQLSTEAEKSVKINQVLLIGSAALGIASAVILPTSSEISHISSVMLGASTGVSLTALKNLITSIAKKTKNEALADKIAYEINMSDLEEEQRSIRK